MAFTYISGELGGETSATQCPDRSCCMVRFKAKPGNTGNVYIGVSSSVTIANGTTDTTTGFVLDAGDDTGWLPVENLNEFWYICDNTGDDFTYLAYS